MSSDAAADACPSCGTTLRGPYCHVCGEHRRTSDDLSLRAFAADSVREVFDADSRLWRSLRALVADPGRLTREWAAGRRRPWISPLRLFLIINIVYFLSQSITGFNTFTTPLELHLTGMPHAALARTMVRERMADTEEDYNLFRARFDAAAETHAKTLVVVLVPFFALAVALLEVRRRRPLAVHLVFALHAIAFVMLLAAVLDPVTVQLMRRLPALFGEVQVSLIYGALFAANLFLAFRGLDRSGAPAAAVRAVLGTAALVLLLSLYRLFLFFTVFYTV